MSRQAKPTVVIVSSPLQLENAKSWLSSNQATTNSRYFVITLSGMPHYDREIFYAARDLVRSEVIFLAPPGSFGNDHRGVLTRKVNGLEGAAVIRPPAGRWSVARLLACLQILSRHYGHVHRWRNLGHVVLGQPFEIVPFLSLLSRGCEVTVVDDGLAVLTTAIVRSARQASKPRSLRDMFRSPAYWTRSLTHYTIFNDVVFGTRDAVIKNNTFFEKQLPIEVSAEECWILGSPEVEEAGLSLSYYVEVLSKISLAAKSNGLKVEYIPHRREPEDKVGKLTVQLGFISRPKVYPVEQRVTETLQCPTLLVGFGSTALETLAQFVPSRCQIWSVLIPAPDRKVIANGANSPDIIWRRHLKSRRIRAVTPEQINSGLVENTG